MRTLAAWCVHHRRIVVLLWIAVLVVSIFSVSAAGTDYSNNFSFPHTQSFDAINLLKSVAPSHSGDQEQVVFGTSGDAKLTDPAIGQRINTMVDKINALPHVTPVTSPYDQDGNLSQPHRSQHQQGPDGRLLSGQLRQADPEHLEHGSQELRQCHHQDLR